MGELTGALARKLLRVSLLLASAGFFIMAAVNLYQIAGSNVGRLLVERSQSEIEAEIDRLLDNSSSKSLLEHRLHEELASFPRTGSSSKAYRRLPAKQVMNFQPTCNRKLKRPMTRTTRHSR